MKMKSTYHLDASGIAWLWLMNSFSEEEDKDAKARRVVRANNFTQQTNVLDVDKHMYVILPLTPTFECK